MAEAAIFSALKVLGDALASELVKRTFPQSCIIGSSNLEASFNNITRELRLMQEFTDRIDIHDQSNENQVILVNEVRKLANNIEDTVAEFVYLVGNKKFGGKTFYVKKFLKDPKSLFALKRVVSQLLKVERSIMALADSRERWPTAYYSKKIKNSNDSNENAHNIITASAHFIDEENVVGIEENRAKLTNWLNSEVQQLSVIAVWGMGGIGKTTLVTNVFNKERRHFDCNAWITISQNYTIENILRNLISEVCKFAQKAPIDTTNKGIKELKDNVSNLLRDKKYFIVLDDMWNPTAFHDIRDVLIDSNQGSRIMITSRDLQVAYLAPENKRLELKPLLRKESWDLFCRKAFNENNHECPSTLKKWATKIVAKCDGLPLALAILGNTLSRIGSTDEDEWKRVHDQLWELNNNTEINRLKNILNLSFTYLPRCLKNCFLYCSLFPEDCLLGRKKMIRLWVAEGFIQEKGRSTLEEVAEGYLKELIYRNMLQVVERNPSGRVRRCRMHDMLRELSIFLCMQENFGKMYEDNKPVYINTPARRISLVEQREEFEDDVSLPQLRTFMVFHPSQPKYPWFSMLLDKSRYIRVLDLEGLDIEIIPAAIGDLFNLHYLGLRHTMVKVLPKSIKKLHNLQTMDLYLSKIQKLPYGIVELKRLRHLFAEVEVDPKYNSLHCRTGIHLFKGVFYLKELQTIQGVESNDMVVRELGNLTQLRSLRIWNVKGNHSEELCRSLSNLCFLSHLCIYGSSENEILHLEGLKLPQIKNIELCARLAQDIVDPLFKVSVECIETMTLGWCQLQNDPLPSLSNCENLTYLNLQRAYEGHELIFQSGWFPKLKYLQLKQMSNLVQVKMEQGTMGSLKTIVLVDLKRLGDIPKGIEHIVSLKWMMCEDMPVDFGGLTNGTQQLFRFTCRVF